MTDDEKWNEFNLVEKPFYENLQRIGYMYLPSNQIDGERESYKEVILVQRLKSAIKRINPWINEENIRKVIRRITHVRATGTLEANKKIHDNIVHYLSVEQDLGDGRKHHTVKIIDWDNPETNELLVTNQFHVWGPKANIIPDIVVFINGLPIVVVECKSPFITNPQDKALTQLLRYQEDARGAPQLFNTNQIIIATCGQRASYSTIEAQPRHFREWKDPWPTKIPDLTSELGHNPNPQEIMIEGMLRKDCLLDLISNFIVFDVTSGKLIKKFARYQQYRAVNKAINRIQTGKTPYEKGGIVWHTQGSGKSLSIVWTALKLRRMPIFKNPIILVVTDRIDLDGQIKNTFRDCGFPNPTQAEGVTDLRTKLSLGPGQTIFTTIHKFQELENETPGEFPVLSNAENIFVMVDEAHRSQEKNLATNMRTAIPNAIYLGFTGTPIDKRDRSTPRTFGSYIDTYSIEQAVSDGATVPIFYEGRLPEVWVEGGTLDDLFERIFKDYSDEEKVEIKRRYATEEKITGAPQRIARICLDLLDHYEHNMAPNGFKAQVVAVNRITAVRYKKKLDELNGPPSEVIISSDINDGPDMQKHHKTKVEVQNAIDRFKDPNDPLRMLIVCDMLLTGFDAPIEQVMYLDKGLKEHNLLQAIARVNRPYENKDYGLIVDYFGVSNFLEKALEIFHKEDVKGAMHDLRSELPRLQSRHRTAMTFFEGVDRKDMEACIKVIEPEDKRAEFETAFKRFARTMDMILPDPVVNPYRADLKWLGQVRNAARERFRDGSMNMAGCGEKVRKLIEDHIRSSGIEIIIEPISILDDNFHSHVNGLTSDEAKASEMEHAIRYEISIRVEENPEFYSSLEERLKEIIKLRKEMRIEIAEVLQRYREIIAEIHNINKAAQELGFNDDEFAFYKILEADEGTEDIVHAELKVITHKVVETLDELAVIDWTLKEDIQRQMRKKVKRILRGKVDDNRLDPVTLRMVNLARVRMKR